MTAEEFIHRLSGGLVVSCHMDEGVEDDALFRFFTDAAERGGAVALRIEGVERVRTVRARTRIPLIGFTQGSYEDGSSLITPAADDIAALFDAGADAVAVDMTKRKRPDGTDGFVFFEQVRKRFTGTLWADIANYREGVRAAEIGADVIATTLSGYTPGTQTDDYRHPDFALINELALSLTTPVVAEGRIWTPEDALEALQVGAHAVVVGSAITRPRLVTSMFVAALSAAEQ